MLSSDDVIISTIAKCLGREKKALEAESTEVARVKRVTAEAGEVLRGGIVFPDAASRGDIPQGE